MEQTSWQQAQRVMENQETWILPVVSVLEALLFQPVKVEVAMVPHVATEEVASLLPADVQPCLQLGQKQLA